MPTGSPAVKVKTQTSAPGNKPRRATAGFTLLELMVVVLIVAVATGMTALSMRDRSQSHLEEEGARLSALLETARTQSRIVGTDVRWEPVREGGFHFLGLPAPALALLPTHWLQADTQAAIVGAPQIRLGPEPLLPAQRVVLKLGEHEVAVGSDGLSPFEVLTPDNTAPAQ